MRTYAQKLRDPRWEEFRQRAFGYHGNACVTCGGEDKERGDHHHIHHKRYFKDREPWEYDMDDVTVLCRECHEDIHRCETKWRNMIRAMPSWLVLEFDSMAEAFLEMDPEEYVQWASYCKNHARIFAKRGRETR